MNCLVLKLRRSTTNWFKLHHLDILFDCIQKKQRQFINIFFHRSYRSWNKWNEKASNESKTTQWEKFQSLKKRPKDFYFQENKSKHAIIFPLTVFPTMNPEDKETRYLYEDEKCCAERENMPWIYFATAERVSRRRPDSLKSRKNRVS